MWERLHQFCVEEPDLEEVIIDSTISTDTLEVIINHPPVARAEANKLHVGTNSPIQFNANNSSDSDGRLIEYLWDFGDSITSEGTRVIHAYTQPGKYEVTLTVKDDSATSSNVAKVRLRVYDNSSVSSCAYNDDYLTVTVNAPPVADAGENREVSIGGVHDRILFDGSGSTDPDSGSLSYYWDFGDGFYREGSQVSHIYTQPGQYKVKLRVQDNSGLANCHEGWDEITITAKEQALR